jgi:hypothetical protein
MLSGPSSVNIGTTIAPALMMPKTAASNANEGSSITAIRSPRRIPRRTRSPATRQLRERKGLIAAIGMGDANCGTGLIFAVCVSIDALVRDVQCVARAIEQVPQSGSTGVFLSVGEKREISQRGHVFPTAASSWNAHGRFRDCQMR